MNEQEKYVQMMARTVGELLDGIDAGDFANVEMIPEKYTYRHLCALFRLSHGLDNGVVLYEQMYDLAMKCGEAAIRKKIQRGEKVKIAFLAISAAEWPAEEVYQRLKKDARCESYIVVCPLVDRDKNDMKQVYGQTCHFFEQRGHEVRKAYDEKTEKCFEWESLGGIPDIVIHLSPWYNALPHEYWIERLPLKCLNCYIPYCVPVVTSADGKYAETFVYNKEFVNMLWKVYVESEKSMVGYRTHELLHGKNALYSGYSKMDYFYNKKVHEKEEIKELWKIPTDADEKEMKRLIIAPHHSFKGYGGIALSTFSKNMYFWIYLVKKYKNEITFILKPHPNMRARAVEAGVFEDFAAFDAYLEEWNSLPNAKVVQETDYRDIFATSDGMIMDSGSFLAEYMYVDKPLLFLRKEGQAFTDLGKKLLDCCYQVRGEDYAGIEEFVLKIILDKNDELGEKRRTVFEEELNYLGKNCSLASECIYQDIVKLFS